MRGHLDNVQLTTAERSGNGPTADWVEECFADGFDGLFTDKCAPGYTRDPPNGGVYAPCVPCMCNGHADVCDKETGGGLKFIQIRVSEYFSLIFNCGFGRQVSSVGNHTL